MNRIDSMSAAVREVIDAYPAGHEFYGNQLKDDVVKIYPEAVNMYPDTILRMARRHRRYAFGVVSQNDSLYKKLLTVPITEQIKEVIPKPEPAPVIHQLSTNTPLQGFLFSFLILAIVFMGISHNSTKNTGFTIPMDSGNDENLMKSQNLFEIPLSCLVIRHDYFGMSSRANIRQPGKPAAKWHAVAAKGALYDNYGRENQGSF